jgi:hypothetical protein
VATGQLDSGRGSLFRRDGHDPGAARGGGRGERVGEAGELPGRDVIAGEADDLVDVSRFTRLEPGLGRFEDRDTAPPVEGERGHRGSHDRLADTRSGTCEHHETHGRSG